MFPVLLEYLFFTLVELFNATLLNSKPAYVVTTAKNWSETPT
jgi:hypothetical protein